MWQCWVCVDGTGPVKNLAGNLANLSAKMEGRLERWLHPPRAWISPQRCCCAVSCSARLQIDLLHARTQVLELELLRGKRSREWRDDERASEG